MQNETEEISPSGVIAGVATVAVIILLMAIYGIYSVLHLRDVESQVRAANDMLLGYQQLLSLTQDAETGRRGYLLTGDPEYLRPYISARSRIDDQLKRVDAITHDPVQRARLQEMRSRLADKLSELDYTIKLRGERGFAAAQAVVQTNRGEEAMDAMRTLVDATNRQALETWQERDALVKNTRDFTIAAWVVTGLLALAVCAGFAYMLRRYLLARAQATGEIYAQKELFRTTLTSIGDGVITTDISGRVMLLNGIALSLTGWTRDSAVGQPLQTVFRIINEETRKPVENPALRALREGLVVGLANHTVLVSKDGSEVPIDDSGAPILDADGKAVGAVLVFRNITDRKRAEDTRKEADRRKDEFLATLAHELRNPLAPLRNALHIARNSLAKSVPGDQLLAMMERQVDQIVRLVDDLLDVARITQGKLELRIEATNIATVINNAMETSAPILQHHKVNITLPPQALNVDADSIRLSQVFSNLLNNAAKYSEDGSPIWLGVEREDDKLVISIRDEGLGIPKEMLGKIFDIFSQVDRSLERSKSGLGIGLTLARQIIEMHSGTIEAQSAGPGLGSTFVVRLPVSSRPVSALGVPKEVNPPRSPRRRILIADDNVDAADSLALLLQTSGHEVTVVYNGIEALKVAEDVHPDVILLDIGMPKMNGYDVASRIRKRPWAHGVFMIAITGWGQDDDRKRSREAGFDQHMVKPIEPFALEAAFKGFDVPRAGDNTD